MTKTKDVLIETKKIKKFFPLKKKYLFQREKFFVRANEDITIQIYKGETLGLVGESGCGKSTLGRIILQLYPPTSGSALYYGVPLREANPEYVIKEIKRLPIYQQKAQAAFNKSLAVDKRIEVLELEIKNEDPELKKQRIERARKIFEDKLNTLVKLEKQYMNETISTLNQNVEIFKEKIKQKPDLVPDSKWEQEVENVRTLLETDNGKSSVADYISLLYMPNRNISLAYKKAEKVREKIEKLEEQRHLIELSEAEINIKKFKERSKELKKEASRQLREGSRTGGVYIVQANLQEISKLMLEEEELHRNIYAKKQRIKKVETREFNKLETKRKNLNNRLNEVKELKLQQKLKKQLEDAVTNEKELKQEVKELEAVITKLEPKQQQLQQQLEDLKYKNVMPITELTQDREYQDKMESNREYAINLQKLNKYEMRALRQKLQIIFQDPYSSLNPRMSVGAAVSEAVVEHGLFKRNSKELEDYVIDIMDKCGLAHYMVHRYPHQFSGGQRQRIVIARALALRPEFVVCDESVSALDVSIQSQILNLLENLKDQENLTYLFISHDLSVIKHISDRIGVMYLGDIVELCDAETLYEKPLHPYSKALISAIPTTSQVKRERILLEGDIPSNIFPPSGCKFRTRCPLAREKCAKDTPELREAEPGRFVACHFYEETETLGKTDA